jgi:hypothetical protein
VPNSELVYKIGKTCDLHDNQGAVVNKLKKVEQGKHYSLSKKMLVLQILLLKYYIAAYKLSRKLLI